LDSSVSADGEVKVWTDAFPLCELIRQYQLNFPVLSTCSDIIGSGDTFAATDVEGRHTSDGNAGKTRQCHAPALDPHDKDFATKLSPFTAAKGSKEIASSLLRPPSQKIKNLEARGLSQSTRQQYAA